MVNTRHPRFENRTAAGRRLGEALREENIEADLVLAIPRGGLPLGRAVADALDVPLDVVVAKKIGAPTNPELAIGAVSADGSVRLNEDVIDRHDIDPDYVDRAREAEANAAREKAERYRSDGEPPNLTGKTVVVVDDGVATGATARACIERVQTDAPKSLLFAVPVGSPRTIEELEGEVDGLVCLETPDQFRAVGQFYEQFDQLSDEEAVAYLD